MKKLLLVFIVFALASSVYAMCPRMAGRRGNANYKRMTECENINECPKEVNGYCIASNLICYGTKCPFKQNESFSFGRNWSILKPKKDKCRIRNVSKLVYKSCHKG